MVLYIGLGRAFVRKSSELWPNDVIATAHSGCPLANDERCDFNALVLNAALLSLLNARGYRAC